MKTVRRYPFVLGLLVGLLCSLLILGDWRAVMKIADAQVPFGAFRIMDGTHTQLARVNHTGQLAVDATVTVATDNVNVFHQSTVRHISSVTHVAAADGGLVIRDPLNAGARARVDHTGALVTTATVTTTVDNVNVFHQSTIRHVSSEVHVAGALMIRDKLCLSCVARVDHTGALVTSATVTVTTDNVNVFHQSTVRHVSSVTHIASAGLAIANQALAVRCVDTGGTTFQACGGGADPSSVVQSSSWTIQAAHLVTIAHIAQSVHIGGTIQGAQFHVQGLGLPGASHGGVLTIQGITGMNAVVVSQATASSLQMTATQTGTWTVQPGNTPNTTAWLVNVQHISSQLHLNIAGVGGLPIPTSQGLPIQHIASVVHIAVSGLGTPTQAISVRCVNTGATAFADCGGAGGSGDAVNVFHQSTVRHVSSVQHVRLIFNDNLNSVLAVHITSRYDPNTKAIVSHAGALFVTCLTAAGVAESCAGTSTPDAVNVFHQSTIAHVSSVTHVMVASHQVIRVMGAHVTGSIHVAGLTNVGSGAPGTGTTQMVCHSTLAIHVAAAAPGYTQIIHLTSSNGGINQAQWRIYICSIMVVSAHAQGFSLLEGTGTTCFGQPRHAVIGSWRPDDSVVLAATGGFSIASPFPVLSTQVPGNNLCIAQTTRTSGGSISGTMSYRAGP